MGSRHWFVCLALLLFLPSFARAAELTQVVTGLNSPVFVTHAGDGSNRLFIVEQPGTIRVLQPGSSAPTLFLDIRSLVAAGGERGLLGLAFHPLYRSNGRFFVYYTRTGDGAIVVSEYRVSEDANAAIASGQVVLTIPHPTFSNHNGGMLAFGPGGYLFIGVGDGGSGNDPSNNAQNLESLLGKLLRIDIDQPNAPAGTRYSSPASNPFVGRAGRDEIFAYGLRNPWRFSFDRATSQLWIADVGQNAREEVNTPVLPGANFGWRVYEGTACTNVDPGLCRPENYVAPLFEYGHSGGRCSITGGYVYRGTGGALPVGTYVYGDFCSGEIFAWDGRTQSLLLDTPADVASFGENELGEIYVVSTSGSLSVLTGRPACSSAVSRSSVTLGTRGGAGRLEINAAPGCAWEAVSLAPWISLVGSSRGAGPGVITYRVPREFNGLPRTGEIVVGDQRVTITQTW